MCVAQPHALCRVPIKDLNDLLPRVGDEPRSGGLRTGGLCACRGHGLTVANPFSGKRNRPPQTLTGPPTLVDVGTLCDIVAIDADDTLWHSQNHFDDAQDQIVDLLSPWATAEEFADRLLTIERANIPYYGFGVKSFILSSIEAGIELSRGSIDPATISAMSVVGKELLDHPIELIEGVMETLPLLAQDFRLIAVTKGDLRHQRTKFEQSGISAHFEHIEVVEDKNPDVYRRVATRVGVETHRMTMIGNSLPSDVLPALEAGMRAIHVPYDRIWSYEAHIEAPDHVESVDSFRDVLDVLTRERTP
jgi:putative hydrolase of the HAD superfamily